MQPVARPLRSRRLNDTDRAIQKAIRNGVPLREAYLANVPQGTRHVPSRLLQGPAQTHAPVELRVSEDGR